MHGRAPVGQRRHRAGPPLQRLPSRTVARHHQSRVHALPAQCVDGLDAAVHPLLHRQPPAVHQQVPRAEPPPQRTVVPRWTERLQVHAQRHQGHVRHGDALELRLREFRCADHDVVIFGGTPVGRVGGAARQRTGQHLTEQPVQPLVRDHHARDITPPRPAPESAQRQPVRHLERVGSQPGQHVGHPPRVGGPVASGPRNRHGGNGDPPHARSERLLTPPRAGHDQHHLVPGGHVSRTQVVQGGAQPARTRPVEVGQLHDAHAPIVAGPRTGQANGR